MGSPDRAPAAPCPDIAPTQPTAHLTEFHGIQRANFRNTWGQPPLPTTAQPTEQALRDFLLEHTDNEQVWVVDCYTYPCVAALSGEMRDESLADAIWAQFPHARVDRGESGDENTKRSHTQIAFLDAPVAPESRENIFVYRLLRAVQHRTARDDFDRLANQEDAP